MFSSKGAYAPALRKNREEAHVPSSPTRTTTHPTGTSLQKKVQRIVESSWFSTSIMTLIVINAITIGIETINNLSETTIFLLSVFDIFAITIYILEAALKIYAYRTGYFKDGWNLFDFSILLLCLIPTSILPLPVQVARVLRVLRVFRTFRLISSFKQIRIIIEAIVRSLSGVLWTGFLLLIIFYVFAVIGTVLFGHQFPQWFGHIGRTLYTLFQVMTLESWSMGIARPVMEVYPWAWVYFVPFVIMSAFIVINILVGIVLDTISQTRAGIDEENARVARQEALECENRSSMEDIVLSPASQAILIEKLNSLDTEMTEIRALIEQAEKIMPHPQAQEQQG